MGKTLPTPTQLVPTWSPVLGKIGRGAAGVTCVGGGPELPRAGHSRFQPALQRMALTHRMTK